MIIYSRIIALLVVIFAGMGIRVLQFDGAIIVWTTALFLLNIRYVFKLDLLLALISMGLIVLLALVYHLKSLQFPAYMLAVILGSYVFLLPYKRNPKIFYQDFSQLLKIFSYYTLFTIPIMIFWGGLLSEVTFDYSLYKTFFYIFWFTPIGGPDLFNQLRPNGVAWEPGIWQMFLNLNLLFALHEKRSPTHLLLSVTSIICVFSTTGLIVACSLIVFYLLLNTSKVNLSQIVTIALPILIFLPLIVDNIFEKTSGQHMGSGMTRFSDFFTGLYLLADSPLIGASQEQAIASNNFDLVAIKTFFWSGNFFDGAYEGYLTVPNSNGYIIFLLDWGIVIGLPLLYFTFKTRFLPNKKLNVLFLVLLYISMSAEPISNTTFFYSFVIFGIYCTFRRVYGSEKN